MRISILEILRGRLRRPKNISRPVLENILVGTLMGVLVGVFLRGYLSELGSLNLDWTIFVLIGLLIGIFSGFERAKKEELEVYGRKLKDIATISDCRLGDSTIIRIKTKAEVEGKVR